MMTSTTIYMAVPDFQKSAYAH